MEILNFIFDNINQNLAIFFGGIIVGFIACKTTQKSHFYTEKKAICGTLANLTNQNPKITFVLQDYKKVVFLSCTYAKGKNRICSLTNTKCPAIQFIKPND
ncbi:hypothetical protein LMG7974_01635 [Campylobacter majalis]|uniref:Lipoprotein n=1 Tax=Campylobacter majalis TaxID=2790656 RepID=A0ABM8Q9A8_9BACT|nr:hypothetical protein [Campylobacter majalis]CAD7289558.1 hypothetical protein LMG7974_01635 [Campylobacter majalis]